MAHKLIDCLLLPAAFTPVAQGGSASDHVAVEITNNSDYDMGDHFLKCEVYSIMAAQGNALIDSTMEAKNPPRLLHVPVLSGGRGETVPCPLSLVLPGPISCVGVKVGLHFDIPGYAERKDKWYNFQFIDGQWVQSNLENATDFRQQHP
jgi:hypothetical protein